MPQSCVIGIDVGGTKALSGVVGAGGEVVHRTVKRWSERPSTDDVLAALVGAVRDAEESVRRPAEAVGVGIPALVDHQTGRAGATMHLPLGGIAVADILSERLGVPVVIDNDAT